jgi:hypothetical protein
MRSRLCEKVIGLKYWRLFDDKALELKLQLVSGSERVYVSEPDRARAVAFPAPSFVDSPAGIPPDASGRHLRWREFQRDV